MPNWGRIICAAGYSGVTFDPADVDIYLQRQLVCKKGLAAPFDEGELKAKLDEAEVRIRVVHRANGKGEARIFTCDLTEELHQDQWQLSNLAPVHSRRHFARGLWGAALGLALRPSTAR